MDPKSSFVKRAVLAMTRTEAVLVSFGVKPELGSSFDFRPFVDAMLMLCRNRRRDTSGIQHLERIVDVMLPPWHDRWTDDLLSECGENIEAYTRWLNTTFPDAKRPDLTNN